MPDDNNAEVLKADMYVRLPKLLDGPVTRSDGVEFRVGDSVRHPEMGDGKVVRICAYQTVGLALYVDFESGKDKIIAVDFLEKVDP
ncbi:MAG: hypothetical protein C0508_17470 [Cyanobacteria bacterium PR.023]|nr:hypothetical protein [Cyanobacteria bacterium PR.023]